MSRRDAPAYLLDANVLIALSVAEHEHHDLASEWMSDVERFAVCPTVEGALVRFLLRLGEAAATASGVIRGVHDRPGCLFWSDELSYRGVDLTGLRGHREVTDAYLATLAAHHGGRLATLDSGLAQRHPQHTVLLGGGEATV